MASIFWLVLFVAFTVGEAATVGLTCIWFALGSLTALISIGLGASVTVQAFVFVGVSGLSMLAFRPMVVGYLKPRREAFDAQSLVGRSAQVTAFIDNATNSGEVRVRGQLWTAESADGSVIMVDTRVRILEVQGARLVVEAVRTGAYGASEDVGDASGEE